MWFKSTDIKILPPIYLPDLHGYVLPHAGTAHSGNIISHTLRYRPLKRRSTIVILYIPVSKKHNITIHDNVAGNMSYYHEFYVPYKSLQKIYPNSKILGYNLLEHNIESIVADLNRLSIKLTDILVVVSADFSHHLPLHKAIELEDCAAHAIMQRNIYGNLPCLQVVDHINSFKVMYNLLDRIVPRAMLQWVGRTRSKGATGKGVGYLSFLLRETPKLTKSKRIPNGFFVTAYDNNMTARECLGNTRFWSRSAERKLVDDVMKKAKTTSRLTGGRHIEVPVSYYTITYLYKDKTPFIRGWHAIMSDALYLPDVFLENTYNNGQWIKTDDTSWKPGNQFHLAPTLRMLSRKANKTQRKHVTKRSVKTRNKYQHSNYSLFSTAVIHKKVNI